LGHKVHPLGFRLGVIKDWQSKWYSETHYAEFIQEDNKLREYIKTKYPEAAISLIEIDRQAKDVTITLHTARPGIVIGRGGQRVDEMRQNLEALIGKKVRLNIQEIRQPELDAYLVARSVAEQIERRVAYRRAMKQAIFRSMQSGAKGVKVSAAGRLANAEIARRHTQHEGQVPLHTLRADIDYGFTEARTTLGRIGVKVWIYKGQVLPEIKVIEAEEKPAETAEETAMEEKPAEVIAKEAPAEEKPAKAAKAAVEEKPARAPKTPHVSIVGEKLAEAVAKAEVKPGKAAKAAAEEKPAKATKAAPAAEEKPAKPRVKKTAKPTDEVKEPEAKVAAKTKGKKAAEPEAAAAVEKPAKPGAKKAAKPAAEATKAPAKTSKKSGVAKPKEED
jgi:small subunit ribosomal protein S3